MVLVVLIFVCGSCRLFISCFVFLSFWLVMVWLTCFECVFGLNVFLMVVCGWEMFLMM